MSEGLKFMWKDGTNDFWAAIIVYNLSNGLSKVEQITSSGPQELSNVYILGQQFNLAEGKQASGGKAKLEV